MRLTLSPRASRRQPMEAAARPLPSEDTTPPVTKMYFADMSATSLVDFLICAWCARLSMAGFGDGGKWLILCWGLCAGWAIWMEFYEAAEWVSVSIWGGMEGSESEFSGSI